MTHHADKAILAFVRDLESRRQHLQEENCRLADKNAELVSENRRLKADIDLLRNVCEEHEHELAPECSVCLMQERDRLRAAIREWFTASDEYDIDNESCEDRWQAAVAEMRDAAGLPSALNEGGDDE